MSLPWRRKTQNSTPRDQPEEPERLPLRWAVILGYSTIGGVGVAEGIGAATEAAPPTPFVTGVAVALAIATGLHKILK